MRFKKGDRVIYFGTKHSQFKATVVDTILRRTESGDEIYKVRIKLDIDNSLYWRPAHELELDRQWVRKQKIARLFGE